LKVADKLKGGGHLFVVLALSVGPRWFGQFGVRRFVAAFFLLFSSFMFFCGHQAVGKRCLLWLKNKRKKAATKRRTPNKANRDV
jgi:hypothetical protein